MRVYINHDLLFAVIYAVILAVIIFGRWVPDRIFVGLLLLVVIVDHLQEWAEWAETLR